MRGLIVLVLVILLLVFVGWITFDRQPGRSSINLETQEIKEDTQEALDSGARMLENTGEAIDPATPAQAPTQEPAPISSPTNETVPTTVEPAPANGG